jgi:hypothetical protein
MLARNRKLILWNQDDAFVFYSNFTEAQLVPGASLLCERLVEHDFETVYVYKKYANKKFLRASQFARDWALTHAASAWWFGESSVLLLHAVTLGLSSGTGDGAECDVDWSAGWGSSWSWSGGFVEVEQIHAQSLEIERYAGEGDPRSRDEVEDDVQQTDRKAQTGKTKTDNVQDPPLPR